MARVINKQSGIKTVGELITSLQRFPADMPIEVGMDNEATVYHAQPQEGEWPDDERGKICIDGMDPWQD